MKKNIFAIATAFAVALLLTTSVTAFAATADKAEAKAITGPITQEQALEIALNHSQYTKDQVEVVKLEKDTDDGREIYEVDFYVGTNRYEYDIEISTGNILEYEIDD